MRNSTVRDYGLSMPLVIGSLITFSMILLIMVSVANLSVQFQNEISRRDLLLTAAQAGAEDYISRLNGYGQLNQWSAAKVRGTPASELPNIIKNSAFNNWRSTKQQFQGIDIQTIDKSDTEFTYDLVSARSDGIIIRVTSRMVGDHSQTRTLEFLLRRDLVHVPALAVEKPYINLFGYQQIRDLLKEHSDQGYMALSMNEPDRKMSEAEYDATCNELDFDNRATNCFRPYFTAQDKFEGDVDYAAPLTVQGNKSFINKGNGITAVGANEWPITKSGNSLKPKISRFRFYTQQPNQLVVGTTVDTASHNHNGITVKKSKLKSFDNAEVASRISYQVLDGKKNAIEPPASFEDLRARANVFDVNRLSSTSTADLNAIRQSGLNVCRFVGATQVVMNGNTIYVRSPHTPKNYNTDVYKSPSWCANQARLLWGRAKNHAGPDVMSFPANVNKNPLIPRNSSSWVTFNDVPDDAIFLVESTSLDKCNAAVVKPQNFYQNQNGFGYPALETPRIQRTSQYACNHGDLFIDGVTARARTFAAEHNVYLTGAIRYADMPMSASQIATNANDVIGIVAKQNIVIYNAKPVSGCQPCGTGTVFHRFPRTLNRLPLTADHLSVRDLSGWAQDKNGTGWRIPERGFDTSNPEISNPNNDIPPTNEFRWWPRTVFHGLYVAEQGGLVLEEIASNLDLQTGHAYENLPNLSATFFGGVHTRYAPLLHVDVLSKVNGKDAVTMYGLHHHYVKDERLGSILPPGFIGRRDSTYRIVRYAETAEDLKPEPNHS